MQETTRSFGTAFTQAERSRKRLTGLIPPAVESLDLQVQRCLHRIDSLKQSPLEQYAYLDRIRTESSNLFYKLVMGNLKQIVSIIYTPTVGLACQEFSRIYTPASAPGLFLSLADQENLDLVISNWPGSDPDICVMTDGSRILGLGDLGVNGMGIPIGKLSLYVAAGGFNPSKTLPITLDLGTNNPKHLNDPFYLGTRSHRPRDSQFYEFVDAVMAALKRRWPKLLVQFEDFSSEHAFGTLERYRNKYFMFNDDIQGTGAVILSGFINALKLSGTPLKQHRILFFGAGSAGVGVASQLMDHFTHAEGGLTKAQAKKLFWLIDSKGIVTSDRSDANRYPSHKKLFLREDMGGKQVGTLLEAIEHVKPTALIGLSSVGGAFDAAVLTRMGELNQAPIVFPLSNPLTNAECTFEDAVKHTQGRVLFASGTAFPGQEHPVTKQILEPGQGNNMYIFPALGFGASLAKATKVTDHMVYQCSVSLSKQLNEEETALGFLYPRIERIREISGLLARDVILAAVEEGVATEPFVTNLNLLEGSNESRQKKGAALLQWVESNMYTPSYQFKL